MPEAARARVGAQRVAREQPGAVAGNGSTRPRRCGTPRREQTGQAATRCATAMAGHRDATKRLSRPRPRLTRGRSARKLSEPCSTACGLLQAATAVPARADSSAAASSSRATRRRPRAGRRAAAGSVSARREAQDGGGARRARGQAPSRAGGAPGVGAAREAERIVARRRGASPSSARRGAECGGPPPRSEERRGGPRRRSHRPRSPRRPRGRVEVRVNLCGASTQAERYRHVDAEGNLLPPRYLPAHDLRRRRRPLRPRCPTAAAAAAASSCRRLARPLAQLRRRPARSTTSARSCAARSTSASPTSTSPTTTGRPTARPRRTSAASCAHGLRRATATS